jgi:hypothetical protein
VLPVPHPYIQFHPTRSDVQRHLPDLRHGSYRSREVGACKCQILVRMGRSLGRLVRTEVYTNWRQATAHQAHPHTFVSPSSSLIILSTSRSIFFLSEDVRTFHSRQHSPRQPPTQVHGFGKHHSADLIPGPQPSGRQSREGQVCRDFNEGNPLHRHEFLCPQGRLHLCAICHQTHPVYTHQYHKGKGKDSSSTKAQTKASKARRAKSEASRSTHNSTAASSFYRDNKSAQQELLASTETVPST